MKNGQTAVWILGAVVVSCILAIGAYFLAIKPQLDGAAEAKAELVSAQDFNTQLDTQIAGMKVQEQQVPLWRGEITAIAKDLPPTVNQSEMQRLIAQQVASLKLPLVSLEFGAPTVVTAATDTVAPAPAPDPSASPEPSSEPSPEPTTPPATDGGTADGGTVAPAAPFEGLVQIPITLTTEGSPNAVMKFINYLSTTTDRYFTFSNFTINKAEVTEATAGRPALTEKEWSTVLTFQAFVLVDSSLTFNPEEPGTNPDFTGGAITNPFIPLPGTEQKDAS